MTLKAPPSGSSSKQASSWWLGSSFWWAFGRGQAGERAHILEFCSDEIIYMHGRRPTGVLLALAENVMRSIELAERTAAPASRGCHDVSSFRRLHVVGLSAVYKETDL